MIDDTTCAENDVPFALSGDRAQITFVVSKSLLSNQALIPDQNAFTYFAATMAWKSTHTGNNSFFVLDLAPNGNNGLVAVPWSATQDFTFLCQ